MPEERFVGIRERKVKDVRCNKGGGKWDQIE